MNNEYCQVCHFGNTTLELIILISTSKKTECSRAGQFQKAFPKNLAWQLSSNPFQTRWVAGLAFDKTAGSRLTSPAPSEDFLRQNSL
jgi:hypothetical protein